MSEVEGSGIRGRLTRSGGDLEFRDEWGNLVFRIRGIAFRVWGLAKDLGEGLICDGELGELGQIGRYSAQFACTFPVPGHIDMEDATRIAWLRARHALQGFPAEPESFEDNGHRGVSRRIRVVISVRIKADEEREQREYLRARGWEAV